jgi:NDP-sugar pyrophosphorylase family protein
VRQAWQILAHDGPTLGLLVATGDVLTQAPFAPLLAHPNADATLLVEPCPCGDGNVGLDGDGLVVRLRNEPLGPGEVSGGFSLGVQWLAPSMREHLPDKGCLVADLYMPLIRKGVRVRACETAARWIDVGTLAAYLSANLAWLGDRPSWVGPGAAISGTVLDQVVVGEGARLVAGTYRRCVVLPGARASDPGESRVYWGDTFADVERGG